MDLPSRVTHPSGMVEYLPDPATEARRIFDEHGLSAMLDLFARVGAIEQAIRGPGAPSCSSIETNAHPFVSACQELEARMASLQDRMQGGHPPCPFLPPS